MLCRLLGPCAMSDFASRFSVCKRLRYGLQLSTDRIGLRVVLEVEKPNVDQRSDQDACRLSPSPSHQHLPFRPCSLTWARTSRVFPCEVPEEFLPVQYIMTSVRKTRDNRM